MKCAECGKELTSNRELLDHLRRDHRTSPPLYFTKQPTAEKFCSKCKQALPINQFFEDKYNNYGFRGQCVYCVRPKGHKRECPICNRIFQWSAVINHLKIDHNIPPEQGYNQYLHEKYCPHCEKVKPLHQFYKLQNPERVYFSWCKECNLKRNLLRNYNPKEGLIVTGSVTAV